MKLAIGFITYNQSSVKYLDDFLPSLIAASQFLVERDCQIYAYDNSDAGNTANRRILENYSAIRYLGQGRNLGFARAYNIMIAAAASAGAEYFLVINPDTTLEPDAIKLLLEVMEADGSLGSAAPKIMRWDFENKRRTKIIDSLGLVLAPGLRFSDYGQGREDSGSEQVPEILGPSGAAGLYRVEALSEVAEQRPEGQAPWYFDERFFMYKEDCDLAYRLFLAGYRSVAAEKAIVYHDRTAAVSGSGLRDFWRDRQAKSRQIRAWSFRNQHYIFLKYWKKQGPRGKRKVLFRAFHMFIFSLILEQYLLKEYYLAWKMAQRVD